MPAFDRRYRALIVSLVLAILAGCGPGGRARDAASDKKSATKPGMEVHAASGRPRLSIVRRDGDPSAAIAIELRGGDGDELDLALASAVIGARLEAASFGNVERFTYQPSRDGQRFLITSLLAATTPPVAMVLNWQAGLKK